SVGFFVDGWIAATDFSYGALTVAGTVRSVLQLLLVWPSFQILDEIEEHSIKIYHLPDAESDEDEDFKEQTRLLKASIPFSVVGSNQLIEAKGKKVRGRLYPWGVVEVENPEHNDFLKLRTMLITHMQDLQEVTQDLHYENFRSERLKRGGRKVENEDMNKDQILLEKEAEETLCKITIPMSNTAACFQDCWGGACPHFTVPVPKNLIFFRTFIVLFCMKYLNICISLLCYTLYFVK
uniref:Septin-type G domain-containing protein n=1 Tax=Capra hircus TaxID=9925 RepID=A0A8C2NLB3_CAPHI